jgi:transcriptional regulator with XRE-family HTH domain
LRGVSEFLFDSFAHLVSIVTTLKNSKSHTAFGHALRETRTRVGLTGRELARKAKISHVALLKIENGTRNATLATALKITTELGLSDKEREKLLSVYLGRDTFQDFAQKLIANAFSEAGLNSKPYGNDEFDKRLAVDLGGSLRVLVEISFIKTNKEF